MTVHPSVRADARWPRLAELVHELAFLDGGSEDAFTLASGRTSRWFFDTKPVMMHPEAGRILGALLNMRINAMEAQFVGGLELGAVPLTALVIATADEHLRGFMVRKSPKGRGGRKTNNPPGIEGSPLEGGGRSSSLKTLPPREVLPSKPLSESMPIPPARWLASSASLTEKKGRSRHSQKPEFILRHC